MENALMSYLWLGFVIIFGGAILYWIKFGSADEQFDEDIKYLVFDKDDKGKMSSDDFAKSQAVLKSQMENRDRHLSDSAKKNSHKE
jgi:hypothetical protein